jgi:hypothetical protein
MEKVWYCLHGISVEEGVVVTNRTSMVLVLHTSFGRRLCNQTPDISSWVSIETPQEF